MGRESGRRDDPEAGRREAIGEQSGRGEGKRPGRNPAPGPQALSRTYLAVLSGALWKRPSFMIASSRLWS